MKIHYRYYLLHFTVYTLLSSTEVDMDSGRIQYRYFFSVGLGIIIRKL
jgi:hypothetical protein